ncbi:uncharacterized protein LAESUDRAFT_287045 [Laetiporus sulphureus 93-53]|uniref:Uncharacterized protein n=1 Tax=Laetiporus sulphureus 93-53 TaxID=1314785 RepID=A0A165DCT2_9APHY|nr:uncharacterized protein LAESUDRAFT_287045 [Laetiporus sulphureus 93-53]KZT04580.1 hypothetical protein LAESUDRAFT_287045 [Laetiporus sulphureus 93-53]
MLETCTITLTPNADGTYQEVKSCTLAAVSGTAAAAAATSDPVVVVGESSIASTAVVTSAAASATATTSVAGDINNDANGDSAGSASASSTASASAASVSKTAESDASTAIAIPGRHILIIPVGLVIFCVLTGIMLLVIFFMHFERMKYRRAFRKRRLAEQGAPMGYGGMGKY